MTYETIGSITSTSEATAIAHSGSSNTKSNWVELDASTAFAVDGFWVYFGVNSTTTLDYFIDIGIGAESSETVLIPDIFYSSGDTQGESQLVFFPISIASGTRISVRQQNYASTGTIDVSIILTTDSGLDVTAYTSCDVIGALTSSDTSGTLIDPGSSSNTKGVYVELSASTANNYKAFMTLVGNNRNTGLASAGYLFDVAIGAVDVEVDFLSNIVFTSAGIGDTFQPRAVGPMACDIPSSSRLSVRAQSSTTNGTDRLFDIVLYGFY